MRRSSRSWRRSTGSRGTAPVPPALLAMVTLLQAYMTKFGNAEAVVNAQLDPRWQLVSGCLGTRKALLPRRAWSSVASE
jgi:hypothetical protein